MVNGSSLSNWRALGSSKIVGLCRVYIGPGRVRRLGTHGVGTPTWEKSPSQGRHPPDGHDVSSWAHRYRWHLPPRSPANQLINHGARSESVPALPSSVTISPPLILEMGRSFEKSSDGKAPNCTSI